MKKGYHFEKSKSRQQLRFAFASKGIHDVIKIISYDYVGLNHEKKTFNLGFGDFNLFTGEFSDAVNTENGDVYMVFNTVLNTIPVFFEHYPECTIMVSGSDSGKNFIKYCKQHCRKKCSNDACKNQHQRIGVYIRYLNKHYDELAEEYLFSGSNEDAIETFEKHKKYDTLFIAKNY